MYCRLGVSPSLELFQGAWPWETMARVTYNLQNMRLSAKASLANRVFGLSFMAEIDKGIHHAFFKASRILANRSPELKAGYLCLPGKYALGA
jgi:hypothetical protein